MPKVYVVYRRWSIVPVIVFLVCLYVVITYWWFFLVMAGLLFIALAVHTSQQKKAAQRAAERLREFRLIRHAEEEQRLVDNGDVAGIYGGYPPPPGMDVLKGNVDGQ